MKVTILALFAIIDVAYVSGRPLEESDSSAQKSPSADSENQEIPSSPEGNSVIYYTPPQVTKTENTICLTFPPKPTDQSSSNTPAESLSATETGKTSEESEIPYGKTICLMFEPDKTSELSSI